MSRIEEANSTGKYKSVLFGAKKNIYTFAIGTPENPMGEALTPEENNKRKDKFEELLDKHRLKYYKQKGRYDNDENSYLIANINLDLCKFWFGDKMFNQESFIYGVIDPSADFKRTTFYYYEQEKGEFVLRDVEKNVANKEDADNFFSRYKNFKFSIPFSIFERVLNNLSNKLEEDYSWDPNYKQYLEHVALAKGRTLRHLWEYSCSHLLTEKRENLRVERVKEGQDLMSTLAQKYQDKANLSEEVKKLLEALK